jgi:hypothetical protein
MNLNESFTTTYEYNTNERIKALYVGKNFQICNVNMIGVGGKEFIQDILSIAKKLGI